MNSVLETMMQKILVIDDDVELCELVAEYLEPDGYKVEAIHEGHEGVQRALSGEHALAVLDYMLPGMNGFEVLEWLRSQPALKRLVVIILTASSRAVDVDRAYNLGANFYLVKTSRFDQFVVMAKSLHGWLRLNQFPSA